MRHLAAIAILAVCVAAAARANEPGHAAKLRQAQAAIQHVVIIMQENPSFDSYFGTFPGANGFPAGTCVPLNPAQPSLGCVKPYHDPHDINATATHNAPDAQADIDDGIKAAKMEGFVQRQTKTSIKHCGTSITPTDCVPVLQGIARHDVMGYHDATEIPNYWAYAKNYVLQDQLYEGIRSWSYSSHLELTSEWAALCANQNDALTCTTVSDQPFPAGGVATLPWANLFQLLDVHGVSWKYYIDEGLQPDWLDGDMVCDAPQQTALSASIWNPAPLYASVKAAGASYLAQHNPPIAQFLADLQSNTLPQVA